MYRSVHRRIGAVPVLLLVALAVGLWPPAPAAAQQIDAVGACHAAVRDRIWTQRGDRSPVHFTATTTYTVDVYRRGVRGRGYVQAPGDVDQFAYDCRVDLRSGATTITSLTPLQPGGVIPPVPVPLPVPAPAPALQGDAIGRCYLAVRDRIWAQRRDRSPVHFATTILYYVDAMRRGVRGTGYVQAPGDIDHFSYDCRVDVRTLGVAVVAISPLPKTGGVPYGPTAPPGYIPPSGYPPPIVGGIPPGRFPADPAVLACYSRVQQRIWEVRRDRSPVEFTSTSVVVLDQWRRRVSGTGQVYAPGDIDQFVYQCSVNIRTGTVRLERLEASTFNLPREPEVQVGD